MTNSASRKKAVVAGHICLDISPVFPETCRGDIAKLFVPGKLIQMEGVQVHIGGAVANTGLAMALYGADVQLMGKIGNDEFGQIVAHIVKNHGVAEGMIISPTSQTSYSVVLALPGHDRIFLHCPGANDTFAFEDLDLDAVERADLFHFGYPPLMKRMYEDEGRELTRLFAAVSQAGVATSLDLAAVDPLSPAGQVDWRAILANTLPLVDIFVPSAEELLFMLDRPRYERLLREAAGRDLTALLSVLRDVRPLADQALQMGARIVLIKCGEPGVYFKTADRAALANLEHKLGFALDGWSAREGFERSYRPERVLSGTGSGDVTIAAFLTALLDESSLETCLQYATASGACCVEAYDSLSGLKPFPELRARMEAGWKKTALNLR